MSPSLSRSVFDLLGVRARNDLSAEQGVPSAAQRSRHDPDLACPDPYVGEHHDDPITHIRDDLENGRRITVPDNPAKEVSHRIRRNGREDEMQVIHGGGSELPCKRFLQFMDRVGEKTRRDDDQENPGYLKEPPQIQPPGDADNPEADDPGDEEPEADPKDRLEGRGERPAPNMKSADSTPYRKTTTNESKVSPKTALCFRTASIRSCTCALMLRAAFIIQRTIEDKTATATSIVMPSKICSPKPWNSIVAANKAAATPALAKKATMLPAYTWRFSEIRPILTR